MEKTLRIGVMVAVSLVLGVCLFAVGTVAGVAVARYLPSHQVLDLGGGGPSTKPTDTTHSGVSVSFAPFWEAWDLVHKEYVDQPVDDVALMQGAISGMLAALGDQHTSYMSPATYKILSSDQSGAFEGIGAYVEAYETCLRIVSPFPGSPAEEAGLIAGDVIIKVDNKEVCGMGEFEIINLVRGKAGTNVHLTVRREGVDDPLEFDVVREKFTVPSVESRMLEGDLAYVKINDFGQNTTDELRDQLKALLAESPKGLVLDLRGNPGGYRDTAIMVASQFIAQGVIMREKYSDGHEEAYEAWAGGLALDIPLVVLINQGSASASEIVAGAIQDAHRGALVGMKSYGKGSVQNWHELEGDNGAVRVTIARWYTPDGRSIHELGITPDVVVEMTEEDVTAKRDPQLDKAVELLNK
jgi:carboxyl-terminal processing protease